MKEELLRLLGFRQLGAIDRVSSAPFLNDFAGAGNNLQINDLLNIAEQSQGATQWCVAFGICHAAGIMATRKVHYEVTFNGNDLAKRLINVGILTRRGAVIEDAMNWVYQNGLYDTRGGYWKVGKVMQIQKSFDKINQCIILGLPVVIGGLVGTPYYDQFKFWLPKNYTNGGGHCECACQTFTNKNGSRNVVGKMNSWNKFGVKLHNEPTGIWYIKQEDISKMFTPFVFDGIEQISFGTEETSFTKKAFEKLKSIWEGAKWSEFIRRWLGKRRTK